MHLLGCPIEFFKEWIEFQFTDGMNWESDIHLDHVSPISSFDLTDITQQRLCFNWSNIQPLFAQDNRLKYNKINTDLINNHQQKAQYFYNINGLM